MDCIEALVTLGLVSFFGFGLLSWIYGTYTDGIQRKQERKRQSNLLAKKHFEEQDERRQQEEEEERRASEVRQQSSQLHKAIGELIGRQHTSAALEQLDEFEALCPDKQSLTMFGRLNVRGVQVEKKLQAVAAEQAYVDNLLSDLRGPSIGASAVRMDSQLKACIAKSKLARKQVSKPQGPSRGKLARSAGRGADLLLNDLLPMGTRHDLEIFMEANRSEEQELAGHLGHEQDLTNYEYSQGLLNQYWELKEKSRRLQRDHLLPERELARHWESFYAGTHEQARDFRHVASLLGILPSKMESDFTTFVGVVSEWRDKYSHIGKELRQREEQFGEEFALFENEKHPQQEAVKRSAYSLGKIRIIGGKEDRFRAFVEVMKETDLLGSVKKGLEVEKVIGDLKNKLTAREEENADLGKKIEALKAVNDRLSKQLQQTQASLAESRNETALERTRRKRSDRAHKELHERYQASKRLWEARRREHQRQLDEERSGERQRQQERERLRQTLPPRINEFLEDQQVRIEKGSKGLRLHPEFGFLVAEARRRLEYEIAKGEWPGGRHTVQRVKEIIGQWLQAKDFDFDQRFLHPQGKTLVAHVNSYLEGKRALSEVIKAARKLVLQETMMADPADLGPRAIIEAWLQPHRGFQVGQYEMYQDGNFDHQAAAEALVSQSGHHPLTQFRWSDLWDKHPWVFVLGKTNLDKRESFAL